jgi:methyl-accepting chemotaxis protein
MINKIIGVVMLLIALTGLGLSAFGIVTSRELFEDIALRLDNTLILAADSLDTVAETLLLTKTTVIQVEESLETVGETAAELSQTIDNTQPLMNQITIVATQELPDSLEAVQSSIPDIAEAAGAIDDTLLLLDSFEVDRKIFGVPIRFDLGVDYQPDAPLDDTVNQLGESLDGIPDSLRGLEVNMSAVSQNLDNIGSNVLTISEDLERINQSVGEVEPLIDDYIRLIEETDLLIQEAQDSIAQLLDAVTLIATALFIWMGLNQIVPLYLAWTLLIDTNEKKTGQNGNTVEDQPDTDSALADSVDSV